MEVDNTINEQLKTIDNMDVTINTLAKTVEAKNKVIKTWGKTHDFYLMSLNDPNAKYPLYAIRSRRRGMNHAIQNLRLKHPHASIMYQWFNVPNPINLHSRLKASKTMYFKRNYCESKVANYDLIRKIEQLIAIV